MATRVTNVEFDGSSAILSIGVHEIPFLKSSISDGLEPERVTETGSQATAAITPGSYKVEQGTISFRSTVFRALILPRLAGSGFGNVQLQLVLTFSHPDIGSDSDLWQNARMINVSSAIEASNKGLEVETKWEVQQVFWGSNRKHINFLPGASPPTIVGPLAFQF